MSTNGITRRDFVNGFALSLAAGTGFNPIDAVARGLLDGAALPPAPGYPPGLTGLRGSHPGSFEVAHALALEGRRWKQPAAQTEETYDLIVVGGGLSGLAAAWFFREKAGAGARILVLDNHDDFGGHAKRNEFAVARRRLIGHGGSQTLESPGLYSKVAKRLLSSLGVQVDRFYKYYDQSFVTRHGLGDKIFFDKAHYDVDRLLPMPFFSWGELQGGVRGSDDPEPIIARFPLPKAAKEAVRRLLMQPADYLSRRSVAEKKNLLRSITYDDYLRRYARMPEEVVTLLRRQWQPDWALGWDALSALEAMNYGVPGMSELGLERPFDRDEDEPYIHHFPDGNASIARLLVRDLIPGIAPGNTMEDIVTAVFDYTRLDRPGNSVRVRLLSTAVDVRHAEEREAVDVTYVRGQETYRVRGRHVILACYNNIISHLCPELPPAQREALEYAEKTPLVYINVALRQWQAFKELGVLGIYAPQAFYSALYLDFPVSMGPYRFSGGPDEPIVLHVPFVPQANDGSSPREQFRAASRRLYGMSFDDYETPLLQQMDAMLASGGFDVERDIAAITVNRWPHGYAYEYLAPWDPPEWDYDHGPHVTGRARLGRISIANSDAEARAYADAAIDAAHRAVSEQL